MHTFQSIVFFSFHIWNGNVLLLINLLSYLSEKRFWMSFSAAVKNSSSSDSIGIFCGGDKTQRDLDFLCIVECSSSCELVSRSSFERLISLLQRHNDSVNFFTMCYMRCVSIYICAFLLIHACQRITELVFWTEEIIIMMTYTYDTTLSLTTTHLFNNFEFKTKPNHWKIWNDRKHFFLFFFFFEF